MLSQRKINSFFFFFLSIIPLSIILGSSISLLNVILVSVAILIILIYQKDLFFLKNFSIKLIFILYFYLIINNLISQDYLIGANRNLGFLRLILLFVCVNYFFFKHPHAKNIFYFWIITVLFLTLDTHIEFFFWKKYFWMGQY